MRQARDESTRAACRRLCVSESAMTRVRRRARIDERRIDRRVVDRRRAGRAATRTGAPRSSAAGGDDCATRPRRARRRARRRRVDDVGEQSAPTTHATRSHASDRRPRVRRRSRATSAGGSHTGTHGSAAASDGYAIVESARGDPRRRRTRAACTSRASPRYGSSRARALASVPVCCDDGRRDLANDERQSDDAQHRDAGEPESGRRSRPTARSAPPPSVTSESRRSPGTPTR